MTRHRARTLQLESLEGKLLLSTLHHAHDATSKAPPLVLDGTVKAIEYQSGALVGLFGRDQVAGQRSSGYYWQFQLPRWTPIHRDGICRHGSEG